MEPGSQDKKHRLWLWPFPPPAPVRMTYCIPPLAAYRSARVTCSVYILDPYLSPSQLSLLLLLLHRNGLHVAIHTPLRRGRKRICENDEWTAPNPSCLSLSTQSSSSPFQSPISWMVSMSLPKQKCSLDFSVNILKCDPLRRQDG
jgi:hypothetical protein